MGASRSGPSRSQALALRSGPGTLTPRSEEGDGARQMERAPVGPRTGREGNLSTNEARAGPAALTLERAPRFA